jgi:hypothetical protein
MRAQCMKFQHWGCQGMRGVGTASSAYCPIRQAVPFSLVRARRESSAVRDLCVFCWRCVAVFAAVVSDRFQRRSGHLWVALEESLRVRLRSVANARVRDSFHPEQRSPGWNEHAERGLAGVTRPAWRGDSRDAAAAVALRTGRPETL